MGHFCGIFSERGLRNGGGGGGGGGRIGQGMGCWGCGAGGSGFSVVRNALDYCKILKAKLNSNIIPSLLCLTQSLSQCQRGGRIVHKTKIHNYCRYNNMYFEQTQFRNHATLPGSLGLFRFPVQKIKRVLSHVSSLTAKKG